jgi:hypothetical protein
MAVDDPVYTALHEDSLFHLHSLMVKEVQELRSEVANLNEVKHFSSSLIHLGVYVFESIKDNFHRNWLTKKKRQVFSKIC